MTTPPTAPDDSLTRIVARPQASARAVVIALTHPAYPPDAHLPEHLPQLDSADVHTILTHPATTAERREELLNALTPATWWAYIGRYSALTAQEILTHSRRHGIHGAYEHYCLLCNPHTPTELAAPALDATAETPLGDGPHLALHAARHHLSVDHLPNAAALQALLDTDTVTALLEDSSANDVAGLIFTSREPKLMVEALKRHPGDASVRAMVLYALTADSQFDAVRQALGQEGDAPQSSSTPS